MYDKVLVAVGRTPNGKHLRCEAAGVVVNERGFIPVDRQQRTNVPHIFAIGDVVGQPMLAHKATHEAKVAAEVIAGHKRFFDARVDSVGGLHRSRDRLGRPHGDRCEGEGHRLREGRVPLGGERPLAGHRPRRRFHQAAVRSADASRDRRRHRRHQRRRPDQRGDARDRDGRGRGRHRPHDPSASDAVRNGGHGGRGVRRHAHRPLHPEARQPRRSNLRAVAVILRRCGIDPCTRH